MHLFYDFYKWIDYQTAISHIELTRVVQYLVLNKYKQYPTSQYLTKRLIKRTMKQFFHSYN